MHIMSSKIDVDRFFLASGKVLMNGMKGYEGGKWIACLIQSTKLLGTCQENGGLRRLELQPVSSIETRSFLGNTVSYVLYALPRTENGATCKGRLLFTVGCSTEGSTRVNNHLASEEFVVSPSRPVAEVLLTFNVTVPGRLASDRTSASLRPIVFIVLVIIAVFALSKNFTRPAAETRRRSCVSRIVELANQCYLPFRRTHVVLRPARIFPWDSESDGDIDELYTTATLKLYGGAEIAESESKYW